MVIAVVIVVAVVVVIVRHEELRLAATPALVGGKGVHDLRDVFATTPPGGTRTLGTGAFDAHYFFSFLCLISSPTPSLSRSDAQSRSLSFSLFRYLYRVPPSLLLIPSLPGPRHTITLS